MCFGDPYSPAYEPELVFQSLTVQSSLLSLLSLSSREEGIRLVWTVTAIIIKVGSRTLAETTMG